MRETRDLFKKLRDVKGIFHAKMGTINGKECSDYSKIALISR